MGKHHPMKINIITYTGNFRGVSTFVIFVVKIPVKYLTFDCTRMRMRSFACARRKLLLTAVSTKVCTHGNNPLYGTWSWLYIWWQDGSIHALMDSG